ncbi:MAG: uracil-DNA glycosylase family protein [Opitutaceae bacterium]
MDREDLASLLSRVRNCTVCADSLPHGPRPVVQIHPDARILVIGQAPGTKVHASGVPWDDPSGRLLRNWMGIDPTVFYDATRVAMMPMGFCYPGKGKTGDLPPRPECAPLWHAALREHMSRIRLTLVIGLYAQRHYMSQRFEGNLTATVRSFRSFLPELLPLPHPSPRNGRWLVRNPWFERELVPVLQKRVAAALAPGRRRSRRD